MDQTKLAELLLSADDHERQTLFTDHAALVDVNLAWTLKALYDHIESSDPAHAGRVAVVLSSMDKITENTQVRAIAAWIEGMAALDSGQIEKAITELNTSEKHFLTSDHPLWAANVQVSKLRALAMFGRLDDAYDCGMQARIVFLSHEDWLAVGKIEQNLGNIHFLRDRYGEAEQLYRSAREQYKKVRDQKQLAQIDNCLATTLSSQHRFHEAEYYYDQALARAEAAGLEITLAEIEANQGCLALFQGHFDRALEYLERSRRRYFALGLLPRSAVADLELADAYLELNLVQEAAVIYERVIPIFSELGMQTEQAHALVYQGRACLALGQIHAAQPLLAKARAIYKTAGNLVGEAMVTLIEAQVLYAQGELGAATEIASYVEKTFDEVHAWGRLLYARWLQGDIARLQKKYVPAETLLKRTLNQAEQWSVLPIIQRCHTSLGLLAAARGDIPEAERVFKRAITFIEETRAPLPAEEFRTAFLADKLTPYTEMVRLCLADGSSSRIAEALGYVESARSRALVDMLGGLIPLSPEPRNAFETQLLEQLENLREELNWFYTQIHRPDSDAALRGAEIMASLYDDVRKREMSISEITLQLRQHQGSKPIYLEPLNLASLGKVLGEETALVEYFSLDGKLLAFVVMGDGNEQTCMEIVQLPGTEDDVNAGLRQFHFQLNALRHGVEGLKAHLPQLTARVQHHLGTLYDILLRPIEDRLGERRLVVVPHRAGHYVPFHALWDGSSYVIERREVSCVPGIAVLRHCLTVPRQTLNRAVLFGISDERNPQVHNEIRALAPLFEKAITRLDDQATRTALFEYAETAQVLHLACHGRFRPDNPLFSSLQLGDGWLTVREAYKLKLKCELVTLSACETGVNGLCPGEELMGLARGFFSAGAPSLLVSLWTVDDEATTKLMIDFYTQVQAGAGLSAALRHAQRQALKNYPHPYFWAPFVLMGRW